MSLYNSGSLNKFQHTQKKLRAACHEDWTAKSCLILSLASQCCHKSHNTDACQRIA